jgi:predicted nuclease with TOPRIM domain
MMKEQFEERLKWLKAEFEAGQKMMADMEVKRSSLESTMLRIRGAIQVVEELLAKVDETPIN